MTVKSPAKVNYYLKVTKKRPDDYHDLVSIMCKVSLFDEIRLSLTPGGIRVACDHPEVPSGPGNIVFRAARLILDAAGGGMGVDIEITKRIPVQAGLGGASSNAASVLKGLAGMVGLGLGPDELVRLGTGLGSDVPFFLFGSPALALGRGEILRGVEGIPQAWLVIVKPRGGISTHQAYKNLDLLLTENEKNITIPKFNGTLDALIGAMSNDFEPIAESMLPEIAEIKGELLRQGSAAAMLTGSGSALFGLFGDEAGANRVYLALSNRPAWNVFLAKNLFD
jgi:4-diphosphocytidyl-2-C-methyl-D-erythritol kinase